MAFFVLALKYQVGVTFVLEYRHAVLFAELQHPVAALHGHHGASGVLEGRDGVDVLGVHAAGPQVFECLGQLVHPQPVVVNVYGDHVDLAAPDVAQCAGEAERLDDYRVALLQQDFVDKLDGQARPGRNQNLVNGRVDAPVGRQLVHQELTQWRDALRAAVEVVHGYVARIAAEHPFGRLDEPFDGHHVRVAVPADEVVLGVAVKRRGRGGQGAVEQR